MINSPFGLASSCIFLLAAMRRILINSRKGSKNKGGGADRLGRGQEAGKVQGLRYLASLWSITMHDLGIRGATRGHRGSFRRAQKEELVDSGRDDLYLRNLAQGWPAEGVNKQINHTQ